MGPSGIFISEATGHFLVSCVSVRFSLRSVRATARKTEPCRPLCALAVPCVFCAPKKEQYLSRAAGAVGLKGLLAGKYAHFALALTPLGFPIRPFSHFHAFSLFVSLFCYASPARAVALPCHGASPGRRFPASPAIARRPQARVKHLVPPVA